MTSAWSSGFSLRRPILELWQVEPAF